MDNKRSERPSPKLISVLALKLALIIIFESGCLNTYNFDKCTPAPPIPGQFNVMTYNVHLFDIAHVAAAAGPLKIFLQPLITAFLESRGNRPVDYEDDRRLTELVNKLFTQNPSPDVVAFTELWNDNMASALMAAVACRYPYQYRPSSNEDIFKGQFLGNGLRLLSKYPITASSEQFTKFNQLDGEDAYSVKGFGQSQIQINAAARATIFFSHTNAAQNEATLDNIAQIAQAIAQVKSTSPNEIIFVMGDLNINGGTTNYSTMMSTLGNSFSDAFTAPGYTFDAVNNPVIAIFSEAPEQERLDYVLYTPTIQLNYANTSVKDHFVFVDELNGKTLPLSDHYPVFASFKL